MKPIYSLLILGALMASCARPSSKVVIDGEVEGYDDLENVTAILFHFDGDYGKQFLSDTLRDGRYHFEIDSLPDGSNVFSVHLFSIQPQASQTLCYGPDLYLEPGAHVRIKGLGRYYYTAEITSPVKDQKLRQHFLQRMSQADWENYQDAYLDYDVLIHRYYEEGLTDLQRDSLRAVLVPLRTRLDSIRGLFNRQELELMKSEPVGQFWMKKLSNIAKLVAYKMNPEYKSEAESLYAGLSPEMKQSPEGLEIESLLHPVKEVSFGDAVPDYTYVDRNGKERSISEFRGKKVLLDFWGNGCGPCMKSIPGIQRLHDQYGDRLAIVSINIDSDRVWKKSEKEHPMTWENWRDPSGYSGSIRIFGSHEIPTFVLISPEGKVKTIIKGFNEEVLKELIDSDEK